MQRMVFDIIHTHTFGALFGASQDIQQLVVVVGTAGSGKVLPHQRAPAAVHVFTDHAAASTLKITAPTGTQVAVANIHHAPQCSSPADHTVYSTRLVVGHLTVVDVKMSDISRNSTSVEQYAFAFRGGHCCVVPILRDMQSDQITVIPTSAEGNSNT